MVAPFIFDARRNNIEDPGAIADAFDEIKDLLVEGFKHENYKGQLYYALHSALTSISQSVKSCDQETDTQITFDSDVLGLFKTSYCQLGEAAIQYGGSKSILPSLKWLFSNNGEGHGPKDKKYKSQLLREVATNTASEFFKKYPVSGVSDEALEFYDVPSPGQKIM